jgi:oligopeptide transport system substrate-binding protein
MKHKASNSQRPIWQRLARLPLLATVTLLLNACGGDVSTESMLNRGSFTEPESLDFQKARTIQAGDVQRDLGEGLTGYTASGELQLSGAERVELSDDGLVYTFWLRTDSKWSNGEKVTAEDFAYSFRRLVAPETAAFYASQSLGDVVNAQAIIAGKRRPQSLGVVVVDEYQLQITLNKPVSYFQRLLTHPSTFPVHRESVELHGNAHAQPGNLVSNGAYKLYAWEVGSYIELVRNEHYRDNAGTSIDRVRHHITAEGMNEISRYRAGELDITAGVPSALFAQMKKERPDELRVSPYLAVYFYAFNLTKRPFRDNPKLRQALSMAVDRETLTEQVIGRGEVAAYGWVPPGIENYEPRQFLYAKLSKTERHAKARQLFNEAGFDDENPLTIQLRYNTSAGHKRVATAIQSMWQDVLGVRTTLVNEEFQVLLENIRAQEITEVFLSGWTGDYDDANAFLSIMESDNPTNMTGFDNKDYDSLMQRAAKQVDLQARRYYLEEAETILLAEHPVMPLYFFVNKNMVSPCVLGWQDNVLNHHYSQHLSLKDSD